jgi:hypothetical protein
MLWRYSRKDTKVLLLATLLLFSGYALLLAQDWQQALVTRPVLTASTVGVVASVNENDVNRYTAALDARARELDAREAALTGNNSVSTDTTTLLTVSVIGIGLLGLILLNFYLDHKRKLSLAP